MSPRFWEAHLSVILCASPLLFSAGFTFFFPLLGRGLALYPRLVLNSLSPRTTSMHFHTPGFYFEPWSPHLYQHDRHARIRRTQGKSHMVLNVPQKSSSACTRNYFKGLPNTSSRTLPTFPKILRANLHRKNSPSLEASERYQKRTHPWVPAPRQSLQVPDIDSTHWSFSATSESQVSPPRPSPSP